MGPSVGDAGDPRNRVWWTLGADRAASIATRLSVLFDTISSIIVSNQDCTAPHASCLPGLPGSQPIHHHDATTTLLLFWSQQHVEGSLEARHAPRVRPKNRTELCYCDAGWENYTLSPERPRSQDGAFSVPISTNSPHRLLARESSGAPI